MLQQRQDYERTPPACDMNVDGLQSHGEWQSLIDGLNHDLAGEYQALLMYTHYSAKLTGPYRRELHALFQAEIPEEQKHAQFLAEKIANLGGEPTTVPYAVPNADQPLEMLQQALAVEKQAIADYCMRVRQAKACGDIGLKVNLENLVADETRHKEELERMLAGWGVCPMEDAPTRAPVITNGDIDAEIYELLTGLQQLQQKTEAIATYQFKNQLPSENEHSFELYRRFVEQEFAVGGDSESCE